MVLSVSQFRLSWAAEEARLVEERSGTACKRLLWPDGGECRLWRVHRLFRAVGMRRPACIPGCCMSVPVEYQRQATLRAAAAAGKRRQTKVGMLMNSARQQVTHAAASGSALCEPSPPPHPRACSCGALRVRALRCWVPLEASKRWCRKAVWTRQPRGVPERHSSTSRRPHCLL